MQKNLKSCVKRVITSFLAVALTVTVYPSIPLVGDTSVSVDAAYSYYDDVIDPDIFSSREGSMDDNCSYFMDNDPNTCWESWSGNFGISYGLYGGAYAMDHYFCDFMTEYADTNEPYTYVIPKKIVLTTADSSVYDVGANPKHWKLSAKKESNNSWTTLIEVNNDTTMQSASAGTDYEYDLSNKRDNQYTMFRFEVFDTIGEVRKEDDSYYGTCVRLGDVRIRGSEVSAAQTTLKANFDYDVQDFSYKIQSGADLMKLAEIVDNEDSSMHDNVDKIDWKIQKFKLTNDIDMASYYDFNMIGVQNPFNGTFDGKGHSITNLRISNYASTVRNVGLFSTTGYDAAIKNLTIGSNNDYSYFNLSVSDSDFENYSDDDDLCCIGSIVGKNKGTVLNCVNYAQVEVIYDGSVEPVADDVCCPAGGIVGYQNYGNAISNCVNYGGVKGYHMVGGILGYWFTDWITDFYLTECINYGTVNAENTTTTNTWLCEGGIVGTLRASAKYWNNRWSCNGSCHIISNVNYGSIENTTPYESYETGGECNPDDPDGWSGDAGPIEPEIFNVGGIIGKLDMVVFTNCSDAKMDIQANYCDFFSPPVGSNSSGDEIQIDGAYIQKTLTSESTVEVEYGNVSSNEIWTKYYPHPPYFGRGETIQFYLKYTGTAPQGKELTGFRAKINNSNYLKFTKINHEDDPKNEYLYQITVPSNCNSFHIEPLMGERFSVNYNFDGGYFSYITKYPTYYFDTDDDIVIPDPYRYNSTTKTYDTFLGWTFEGQETPVKNPVITSGSTGNKTFTAHWEEVVQESTITFDTAGGSAVSPITQVVGTAVTAPENPTKEGYTFDGWEPELPETMPANDMTVTAKWKANRYTITFDTAGGTALAPITKEYGETITAPENPTKTGYTFAGWSNEIPSTMPAENITITANWTVNQYTITFDTNGGSTVDSITQDYGTAVTAPENPTKTGYTFANWDKTIPAAMPAENITITANWTVNQYTITFDTNGGSTIDSITQDYGTAVTAPENPTKTGYTFAGWNNEIPSTMPAENITITANWTVNQYTITFDTNGGSEIPAITQDYGTAVTAPENPTKEGYTFTGWDKAIPTTMPAEDMTITAHWAVNPHTVTFNTDGGSEISPVTLDYGKTITPPDAPEKEGYDFAGWSPELPSTMPDEDITVTAQWTPKQYTITFNTDGGTEIAAITQNYGTAVTAPENPTKTGYTFSSWDSEIPSTMPAENITITANWTVNQYTITFMDGETILDTITQDYNTAVTAPENPTKTGYTFTGWEPECPAAMPAENKTLTAQWQINQYTITFDTNGGSTVDSITQDYGTAVTAPENPTKDGYIFSSWSPSLPETMPAENMTVAAIWKEDPHFADTERTDWIKEGVDTGFDWSISEGELTIYGDGGMPSMPSASDYPWASLAQYITKITIDSGIINIADNAFCSTGNIQYLKLRIVCLPDTVTEIGENAFRGAVNLNELDWKYNEDFDPDVTIIIKSNAFKGCVILDVTLMVIQTNNGSGAGTGAFEGCIKARIVIFDANGGTGTQAGISADENGIITLPVCTYHSPGERFDFAGWLVNGNIYYPNESVQISEDITVTAQWKKWVLVHAYTRTKTSSDSFYDISSFDIPHINYSGDTVTLTALNKRAQGYSFMGWYTVVSEENGIVTAYGELVSDMLNYSFRLGEDDLQLVAVYKANEKSQLNIFSVNGAQYRIDDKSTIRMGSSHTVPIGTKVTVTAVDPQKVLEWISGNNQIIGKGESVTVEVAGQKNLSLVYRSEIPNQSFVQFVSDYQQVMQFDQVSSEDDIIIPAGPSKLGYVFDHWVFEGTNDTADAETIKAKISTESVITLKPAYVASNQQFTVTVNYVDKDGNALQETTSASVNVGTTYQITAPVIDGNQAAYWKDSSGNIICYGENCFRLVKEDITLTACYVPENEEVQAQPVITLGDFSVADVDGAHKILCTATRNMPSTGYHVKANGILVCKNPDQLTESNFTYENIDGTVILNAPNSYNTINGTFTLTLNVQDDDMLVAFRGYMIVEDSVTGTQNIYYSDIKQTNYSSVNIGE